MDLDGNGMIDFIDLGIMMADYAAPIY